MLAWWGVFPVIAFAVAQVAFGFSRAKLRTSPDNVLSYWLASVFVGLLLATLVAWIAYRIGKKSQLAGTVALTVVLMLATTDLVSTTKSPSPPVAPPSTRPRMATFGEFKFEIPAGWTKVRPTDKKAKAVLVLNPKTGPDGMLRIEVGRLKEPTPRKVAAAFAGDDGRVLDEPISLDGIEGARAEMPSTDLGRPRFCAVVFREEKGYLIMAAGANEHDIAEAFEHVIKTWQWCPRRSR